MNKTQATKLARYADILAQRLIEGKGKCPMAFAREYRKMYTLAKAHRPWWRLWW